ncbi:MAG: hypothetical protein ACR2K5_06700 [Pseudolabrys sp.]
MSKLMTLAAAGALALAVTATSQPARAGNGGAVAAGVVGGLAAGAIIGSQLNQRPYYGGPAYYQAPYEPVYRSCHIERQEVVDQWGRVRFRRIRVCD